MVKVMKQYRRDLGYPEMVDFNEDLLAREELLTQLISFLFCLNQEISIYDGISEFSNNDVETIVAEAFDFLRYLGKIPRNNFASISPEECDELKSQLPFSNAEEMVNYYRKEQEKFNSIQWEYLDTTHFKHHLFPIKERTFHSYKIENLYPFYRRENVLSSEGRDLLREYQDCIRFHNPNTVEGRRMLIFQDLYRLYLKGIGEKRAHPYFIDWSHCVVRNWPANVDKYDINSWSEEQLETLSGLLKRKSKGILFNFKKSKGTHNGLLGNVPEFNDRPCSVAHFINNHVIFEQDPKTKK